MWKRSFLLAGFALTDEIEAAARVFEKGRIEVQDLVRGRFEVRAEGVGEGSDDEGRARALDRAREREEISVAGDEDDRRRRRFPRTTPRSCAWSARC